LSKQNREILATKKWTEIRKKGKERYILVNGVLKYGLSMGIAFPIIQQLVNLKNRSSNYTIYSFIFRFIACFIIFSIAECIMNNHLWNKLEKKYEG
jgi:hypothetical protein